MEQTKHDMMALRLTAMIVAAHIGNTEVPTDALSGLIKSVYQALITPENTRPDPVVQEPAVPIKRSVFPEFIICLEDGRKLKMLKKYLMTKYKMTPDAYRAKWGLPKDYPMTAPRYSEHRSKIAKSLGLGRKASGESRITHMPARRARGSKG